MPTWDVGDTLTVAVDGAPRFTGTLTDVELAEHVTHNGESHAVFDLQGIGAVGTLGYRDVGDTPWPVEPAADRARSILQLAGVPTRSKANPR